MLKRDFIMVQIEELGKVLAQLVGLRHSDNSRKAESLTNKLYESLQIDKDFLLTSDMETIRRRLDQGDHAGLQRMELAAKTLLEESYQDKNESTLLLSKAKEMLLYIQQSDNTFSIERVELIDLITKKLEE